LAIITCFNSIVSIFGFQNCIAIAVASQIKPRSSPLI
jgi:hypothetical protein